MNLTLTPDQKKKLWEYQTDPIVSKLKEIYNENTFLEFLGVTDKEDRHTDFLCSLLNEKQTQEIAAKGLLYAYLKDYDTWVKNGKKKIIEEDVVKLLMECCKKGDSMNDGKNGKNKASEVVIINEESLNKLKEKVKDQIEKVKDLEETINKLWDKLKPKDSQENNNEQSLKKVKKKLDELLGDDELLEGLAKCFDETNAGMLKHLEKPLPDGVEDALLLDTFNVKNVNANTRVKLGGKNGGVVDLIVKIEYEIDGDTLSGVTDEGSQGESSEEQQAIDNRGENSEKFNGDAEAQQPSKGTITIVLENKVWTNEHKTGSSGNDQTQEYYNAIISRLLSEYPNPIFEYLTPTGMDDCACPCYAHITYQDLLELVFEPIQKSTAVTESVKLKVRQYVEAIDFRKRTIAVRKTTEDLIAEYWRKYGDVVSWAVAKGKVMSLKVDNGIVKAEVNGTFIEVATNKTNKANKKTSKTTVIDRLLLDDSDEMIMSSADLVEKLNLGEDKELGLVAKAKNFKTIAKKLGRDYTKYKIIMGNTTKEGFGKGEMVARAIEMLLNGGVQQKEIQDAWERAFKMTVNDVVKELKRRGQATFTENDARKPTIGKDGLFPNRANTEKKRYTDIGSVVVSNQWGKDIDYFVYMVNVIGHENGRNWPITTIEKM